MPQNEREWRAARRRVGAPARREELAARLHHPGGDRKRGHPRYWRSACVSRAGGPAGQKSGRRQGDHLPEHLGEPLPALSHFHPLSCIGSDARQKVFQVLIASRFFSSWIAGTYTPITLLVLDPVTGWTLFAVVWTAAILGIVLNSIDMKRFRAFFDDLLHRHGLVCHLCLWSAGSGSLSAPDLWLLIGGGIAYTVGAVLYGFEKSALHSFLMASFCARGEHSAFYGHPALRRKSSGLIRPVGKIKIKKGKLS